MPAHPEHALQVEAAKFTRLCVAQPHVFQSIDRSRASSRFTHMREKSRGLKAGTQDSQLIVPGFPLITVEFKAKGGKPTEAQKFMGTAIQAAGAIYAVVDSVSTYAALLQRVGIPLLGPWQFAAQYADAALLAHAIKREERKTGRPSKSRFPPAKPTRAKLRRIERLRAQGIEP